MRAEIQTSAERPTAVVVVWCREETCWVRCTVRKTQASGPRLIASDVAAKRCSERAIIESTRVGVLRVSLCDLTAASVPYSSVVYECVPTERCSPSALLLASRPEPAPADCNLTTERRAARRPRVGREATSLYSCVANELIDRSAAVCCRG